MCHQMQRSIADYEETRRYGRRPAGDARSAGVREGALRVLAQPKPPVYGIKRIGMQALLRDLTWAPDEAISHLNTLAGF